jgi:DNA invertase Pin-like site-specific DNA recombinase
MSIKKAAIYTRVSTMDQHPGMQRRELVDYVKRRGWSLCKEYSDTGVSGAVERRRALDELLEDCRRKRIDIVVVWKFDRFARSLKQLLNALELFRTLNIGFVSCTEAIDTSLPHGEMLFQIIGAIAQWERSLIVERVRAGLQHARNQGKRLGRPPLRVFTPKDVARLRKERKLTTKLSWSRCWSGRGAGKASSFPGGNLDSRRGHRNFAEGGTSNHGYSGSEQDLRLR